MPVNLLKVTLLRGSFPRFLNCANGTKSCKSSYKIFILKKKKKETVQKNTAFINDIQSSRILLIKLNSSNKTWFSSSIKNAWNVIYLTSLNLK